MNNQLHGKIYEDYIKSAFPGSSDHERPFCNNWDVEAKFDKIKYIPTAVKTTKNDIVYLADARKFWSIKEPYRLLIGKYNQNNNIKSFYSLYEFNISIEEHKKILGSIPFSEIETFHNNLKLNTYEEARKYANIKTLYFKYKSLIQLNAKIDKNSQRRLQCSININHLISNIQDKNIYLNNNFYRNISVNFNIISNKRNITNY